jgi:hypothetical protein
VRGIYRVDIKKVSLFTVVWRAQFWELKDEISYEHISRHALDI